MISTTNEMICIAET